MKVYHIANNYIQPGFGNNSANRIFKSFIKAEKPEKDCFVYNDILNNALNNLENLYFDEQDVEKVKNLGAKPLFKNGKEALEYAKAKNIKIAFAEIDKADIHAQWINDLNTIIINNKYKNSTSKAEIFAISAAILHELSHAKDSDSISSIQEEIDCLSMNALAFKTFRKKNPGIFDNVNSPLLQDGVALYEKLFFCDDKKPLIRRIQDKYGYLNLESPNHKAGKFANEIKSN